MKKDNSKRLVIRPGTMKTWSGGRWASIYCSIKLTQDGKLSISGVIGPLPSGNALGSYGQIDMGFWHKDPSHNIERYSDPIRPHDIRFRPGWTASKWLQFLEYWELYHLNNMRPGCEHQTAENWGHKEIKLVKVDFRSQYCVGQKLYHTIKADIKKINGIIKIRRKRGLPLTTMTGSSASRAYLQAKVSAYKGEVYSPTEGSAAATWIGENKPIKITTETKTSGWVDPSEHPDGELTKPCPVCGYKYGTAWNKSDVPADVIKFLFDLPPADQTPVWV